MKILWIVVGIVYFALALSYFYLAWKSRQKVRLKNIQIDRLPLGPSVPKGSVALEDYANYLADSVQKHLNRFTFPTIEKYLDETSRINTRGFIIAGVLSLLAATLAFLSAFLIL